MMVDFTDITPEMKIKSLGHLFRQFKTAKKKQD